MQPREVGEEESREKRVQKSYFLKLSGHVGALKRCSLTIKASVLTQLSFRQLLHLSPIKPQTQRL